MDSTENKELSTSEEDDKKFASEAVKFVIGHTRNGFVSLCASVATLLKEKANLEKENESLKGQIESHKKSLNPPFELNSLNQVENCLSYYGTSKFVRDVDQIKSFKFRRKDVCQVYRSVRYCLCKVCAKELMQDKISPPLKNGDRIVVAGEICGSVVYFGHIDELNFPEIFVGLHLDEAVGDCNGTINRKTYFEVPSAYGLLVPLFNVCCIMN
ncbi:uncharacterized protein [Parasteatoda tepidariorum]|uniref:uncharacterized protein n=1 Tax=Parasteatoda tepidariorum TaxID=114398 RepID=UPI00077FC959|nr:uncharacterized protein LOC107453197 [Parasteatoda tepidariorum]